MHFSLRDYLSSLRETLEKELLSQLSFLRYDSHPLLFEAASYCLLNPGKRIRPLLTLCAVDSLQGNKQEALVPACAIEILHTYSLIHDDLPCMDDDDLRRGRPTLHKLYPEGQAVLTGDMLLTWAFEVLASAPFLSAEKTVRLVQLLAKKSGGHGMILGQSLDLSYEGKVVSWDLVREMHEKKTGDLISASLEFAAIIAGVSQQTQESLSIIGKKVGLSFQIIDDLLDVEGESSEKLGKPLYSDLEKEKNTSVSLLGLEKSRALAQELLSEALEECRHIGLAGTPLFQFLPGLVNRSF